MEQRTQRPQLVVDPASGLVAPARQCPSPNVDERPVGVVPELIVVHSISLPPAQYGGDDIDALFTNRLDAEAHPYFRDIAALRVSAHCLIRRTGALVQYVAFHRRAWHAGVSSFAGREACNDFSIGIELEGTDTDTFDASQYATLNALISALRFAYPSLREAPVVGHSDIAPGRKTDPGVGFDWSEVNEIKRSDGYSLEP